MEEKNNEAEILRVFAVVDKKTGNKTFAWKIGKGVSPHLLIGLLENIKGNLLIEVQKDTSRMGAL